MMEINQGLALASAICECYALVKLLSHIKRTHLVYGILVDFLILQVTLMMALVVSGLSYRLLATIAEQYQLRYPLDIEGGITYPFLLVVQCFELYLAMMVAFWVVKGYRVTHHCWQYWSVPCKLWLTLWAGTIGYFVYCWYGGKATINALDIVEAIRCGGDFSRAVRFMPQVMTNLFTSVFKGFPRRWWMLEMMAMAFMAIAVIGYHPFVSNMPSMVSVYIEAMLLICLGIQRMLFVTSGSVLPT